MSRRFPIILLSFVWAAGLSAQTLEGVITDREGIPVSNASVYIREAAQGIMADDKGEFQARLANGGYTLDISSLGYEKKTVAVAIDKPSVSLSVVMEKKTYALKEVIVRANREDPAYAVMRKAIAMAPFYLHQVKSYESEVYDKGSAKVEKIPALFKVRLNNMEAKNLVNRLLVMESHKEVRFTDPDKYEQTIKAYSSTIPEEISGGEILKILNTSSIYAPDAFGWISPLSPGAFSYYKFTFEGISREGEHWVNKIRVQPKKKNAKLVSGRLYIVENAWNVHNVDLTATQLGVTVHITISYNEVKPYAFLPTAYNMDVRIDAMGVKASAKHYSSVQYKDVVLNEAQGVIRKKEQPPKPQPATVEKPQTPKQQKAQRQLEALSEKENLSNRDAYKMAKLMREAAEPEESRKERESLELLSARSKTQITVDTLAQSRDSLYWSAVRNLPLREEELQSYREKDSLILRDSLRGGVVSVGGNSPFSRWLMGDRIRLKKKYSLRHNGLLGTVGEYNFADGFRLGHRLEGRVEFAPNHRLTLSPAVYYATARRAAVWQVDGTYRYAPMRNAELFVSGGNTTTGFNAESGDLRLINAVASLFFAENPVKLYRKEYLEARHRIDVANGLILTAGMAYEKRSALENRTSYSFFGGTPSPNIPAGQAPMPGHTALKASLGVEYTPRHHYRVRQGRKVYAHSAYPTFSLRYEKAFPGGSANAASFDRLEAGIRQEITLNAFDRLGYRLNAGIFLSSKYMQFPDYKHFDAPGLFVTGNSPESNFSLPGNYAYSTSKQWLQAHLNYTSAYLLIKRLPFLQNYLFDESLHLRTLWIPGKSYQEAGYSAGLGDMVRVGVFAGFENGKYHSAGLSLSLPLLKFKD
ncbi:MAG: DUF5686 and carboxypeptidase regulatory-like domain-containing protein [Tannerellaceae bacterium]|jgi:hypothetical protein|nr:DUF5686 and carboxypeptidase regulatory-like domain-containing protein [Tannerellaceae bacterium]